MMKKKKKERKKYENPKSSLKLVSESYGVCNRQLKRFYLSITHAINLFQ